MAKRDPAQRPHIKLPNGYDDEASFLQEMRELFAVDNEFDRLNREAALDDLSFLVGNQWEDTVRMRREAAGKPTLTINRIPAFVAQIVGQRRMSETTINVVPDNGGTQAVARVRKGLIRNIQKQSRADLAYDKALEGAASCGIGNFGVELDYQNDDVFEQDIKVVSYPDHLSVLWDRMIATPDGQDAGHVFVIDTMPKKEFYDAWPWATPADVMVDWTVRGDVRMNGWIANDDVRIVSYWRMRTRKRVLALLDDGTTQDITDKLDGDDDKARSDILSQVMQRPEDGSPIMREVDRKYAEMYLCSGTDVLEGPYQLPISRVPVFRVPGWEINVGEYRHRWGIVRFAKDPQRLHNYFRSIVAEKLMQTPRAVWMAADTAVQGREQAWRQSHLSDDSLLVFNAESGIKPERVQPAQMEAALLGQAEITSQDIKDVTNIHEANLGMPSNEVSGVAIMARQRVSDTGTILYHDNLNQAIEEAGRVINELIPVCYDTPRIVKVIGDDAREDMQIINATSDPRSIDLDVGRYSVTVTTGPSYATKRLEAAASMEALANAMPQVLSSSIDLIVDAQDWPGKEKIVERLRKTLPPGLLGPDEMTPEIQANAAQAQQKQQVGQQAQLAMATANYMKTQSETALNSARARNFDVQAESQGVKDQNQSLTVASQAADRELRGHLESVKVASSV